MNNCYRILSLFLYSGFVFASGGGEDTSHVSSISDLFWPTFNFVLLFSFFIWKLKKPILQFFSNNSDEVKYLFDYAEEKNKEASLKLEMYEGKLKSLPVEIKKIKNSAELDLGRFEEITGEETGDQMAKLEKNSFEKMTSEKNNAIKKIGKELLEAIVTKTKNKIEKDKGLQDKAVKKIMSKI